MSEITIGSEKYIFDKFAKAASGSVYYQEGKNVLLAVVSVDTEEIVEEDFLPLTVQYIEKAYANGKFPGGYIKRESKPGDFETLSARIVDRSLRPLFPKEYCYPTQISIFVLSVASGADLQVLALNAASAALYVSEIPITAPVNGVRIGKVNNKLVINPNLEESSLDLLVSGVNEDLLMIEMRTFGSEVAANYRANEMSEEELLQALELAKNHIAQKSQLMAEKFTPFIKPPLAFKEKRKSFVSEAMMDFIYQNHLPELKAIIQFLSKTERDNKIKTFACKIANEWIKTNPLDENLDKMAIQSVAQVKREVVRAMILKERKRADGRDLKEVRPISIETNFLPCAHSSVLFTRGQTQALVVATLGGDMDAQSYELLTDKVAQKERFMVHYNFPPFSVGEVGFISAPGRRELGHGNLAKRALESSLINPDLKSIRLVSEILESNGSSSMATVCGGSLALAAAGIECVSLIAGVAMGLVVEGENFAVLTDIMGLEDHEGDMDFKVAGSREGITALQMDIKLGGLKTEILRVALSQAKEAREHILTLMEEARDKIILNEEILPSSIIFAIPPSKIVEVIGQGGKTIKEIVERFEVTIDLNRDNGEVKINGNNREQIDEAKEFILNIANTKEARVNPQEEYKVGDIFVGKVKKILEFGAFVELPKGYDGLLHISKITPNRNDKISDYVRVGDDIKVEILSLNKNKVELGLVN